MRDRLNLMQQFCNQIKARFQGINLEYNETEMKFGDFCLHLAKLEATPKRLEMTSLVSELLKQADPQEIDKVVVLALGRLAPMYQDIDFGLAEKTIIRSLASAYNLETKTVIENFKKAGDLGIVAGELKLKTPAYASRSTRSAGLTERSSAGRQNSKLKTKAQISKLSVTDVFDRLLDIADQSGKNSQERKLDKTAKLLRELDPLGAKYAVRIILGNLRLGFSDKTVLDALSVMIAGDKSAREKLEAAYNVRPDVGWLAKKIQNSEFPGLASARPRAGRIQNLRSKPELGTPILPALCQRLPAAEEIIEKMRLVAVEPKWDGQRIQAHAWIQGKRNKGKGKKETRKTIIIKLFTRSLENVTAMFPDLVNALHSLIQHSTFRIQNWILDGEAVAIDPKTGRVLPFQTMITRKRKYGIAEKLASVPIKYMVFDILYLNGKSLLGVPFQKRRAALEKLLNFQKTQNTRKTNPTLRLSEFSEFSEIIQPAPQLVTSDPGEIRKFLKQQIGFGLEGIVAKRTDAPYIPGRTQFAWVKLKWEGAAKSGGLLDTVDCVVMGTYAGKGKRTGFGVGAFLVGILSNLRNLSDLRYLTISKIGTGLTDEQWRELKVKSEKLKVKSQPKEYEVPKELTPDAWLKPQLVAEIQADNITKSPLHSAGFALRFPRLVRYRNDKNPDQATTLEEIKKLYQMSLKH